MTAAEFKERPVTGALGAVIEGVDLSRALDDQTFDRLYAAWLEHQVLFFKDQSLSDEAFEGFVKRFGEIEIHPFIGKVDGSETVERLENKDTRLTPSTSTYHIDVSMMEVPTKGAALYAVDVAETGGDTIWVNLYAAYEGLSQPMQQFVDSLSGRFVAMHKRALDTMIEMGAEAKDLAAGFLGQSSVHPLVHVHPETGRKALFVDELFMWSIVGLSIAESDALKTLLFNHIAKPEFQCRWHWEPGSLAIWDNRCTMHRRVDDAGEGPRIMHRLPIRGTAPPAR